MSDNEFASMLDEYAKTIRNGEVVTGTVLSVKPEEIILNINYKSDGVISRNEYSADPNLDLTQEVSVGDEMEAKVVKVNDGEGQVILSYRRLAAEKGNQRLKDAYENDEVLTGKVVQVLKGGLSAEVDGAKVFIPASLISDGYVKDLSQFKGQDLEFKIIEFEPRKRRVIGDRKQLIVADKRQKQDELLSTLKVGDVIDGTVKNVTNFGAFVDLGGIDGLLHISEMSWGRVDNPAKLYHEGDSVKVFIKDIKDEKIALSRKFPDENPWNDAAERYAVGNIVKGKVARMADFGAFIELAPGIDGLLHVSQISKDHIDKPSDVLTVGQEVEARVVELRENEHKISLSLKALNHAEDEETEGSDESSDYADVDVAKAAEESAAETTEEKTEEKVAEDAADKE